MKLEKFTLKMQEAIEDALFLAREYTHQQIEPEHLLYTLLKQEDSIIISILDNLGLASFSIIKSLEEELKNKPKVSSPRQEVYFSQRLNKVLMDAQKEAKILNDEYISGEHILLAEFNDIESLIYREFKKAGIDKERVLFALQQVRGNQRITDVNPEEKFKPLERYGRDLTELANQGRLDPVIGRDDEIRRLIQVIL
ncbi:MAG: type VI secretion system ATPase TssH, partial [Candidatus Omnitrophica bacterium]|nr:type VI secretion system ATPase TssH [Candidatus Omnitrophota bacterium]